MIGIISAVSANGIIGITDENCKGKLPFNYPADMTYFRETTKGSTIIMGRKTFESIGKPLPRRRNIVISSKPIDMAGVETFPNITEALANIDEDYKKVLALYDNGKVSVDIMILPPTVWLAGGARIYEEGMQYADELHITVTPDIITQPDAIRFPWINPCLFEIKEWRRLDPVDDTLRLYVYKKTC